MKINSKIASAAALLILVLVACFWWLQGDKQAENRFVPREREVTMQLVPLPMIVDGTQKDSRLSKLLANKEEAKVILTNLSLDLEPIFMTSVALKNLSIEFAYDKKRDRIEFQGQSNQYKHLKVSGYYELTTKSTIRYYIVIKEQHKEWVIDSTYAPAYLDNESEHEESVTGTFEFKALDLLKAVFDSNSVPSSYPASIKGSFVKKDNFLDIKDLDLKSNELEANVRANIKGKNLSMDAAINKINLDNFSLPVGFMDRALSLLAKKAAILNINGTFNCDSVTVNGTDLKSLFVSLTQKDNSLQISELKFSLPDSSILNASGKVLKIRSGLGIDGSFNLSAVKATALAQALGLGDHSSSSPVSLSSRFELTPTNLKLKELNIKEGATSAVGDLSLSNYAASKNLTGNIEIKHYSTESASFIGSILNKNSLLSKAHSLDYEAALEQNKKQLFLKDISVKFIDLKTSAGTVKKLSTRYIETPNSIELEHFTAEDPRFNLHGKLKFSSKEATPHLDLHFEGDKVDMAIFNDVVLKSLMYQGSSIILPRFNTTTGDIRINLKSPDKKAYVSEVNCTAQLANQILMLNDCSAKLFNGKTDLTGKFELGKILGYNVGFSNKNVNMNRLVNYLLNENKKITGIGEASVDGNLSSSGFNTWDEMMKSLTGNFKFKADHIGLTAVSLKSLIFKYGTIKNIEKSHDKKETQFYNLDGEFGLVNGKLESKQLSFVTKENIHGKTNFIYKLKSNDLDGILSLAYFDKVGKVDGFNVTFSGDIRKLQTKLGTHVKR